MIFGWDSSDVCYDNAEITGWHTGYPDAKATIDITTFREIPWENSTPFFLADFSSDEDYDNAVLVSRSLLKRVAENAKTMGFTRVFAQEFEWFNFKGTPSEINESGFKN